MTEEEKTEAEMNRLLEEAFIKEYDTIFRLMLRSVGDGPTAEDLAQDVFMKALEQRDSFRNRGPGAVGGWLKAIARSMILMRNRREEASDRAKERLKTEPILSRPPSPEEVAEEHHFHDLCARLRAGLPADVRMFMHVWAAQRAGHLTAPEAAEVLGIWVPKYEAEKKRIRRLVVRTADALEEHARIAKEKASSKNNSAD